MMGTTPTAPSEVGQALQWLSVLEMAKDATKLKQALLPLQEAQQAAAEERQAADKAIAGAKQAMSDAASEMAKLEQERARLKEDQARLFKNGEDIEYSRAEMVRERTRFDDWMARERELLSAASAKVQSDAATVARRAQECDQRESQAGAELAKARGLQAAAEALRLEYEQKLNNLKAMVG